MKNYFLPHTGLLFSSLAILSLGLTAAEPKKPASGKKVTADNTAKNEQDRSGETKTPMDQSNKPEDIKVTQEIRKAVMDDSALSFTAKNVKIITAAGKVTLRGAVDSTEEKAKIAAYAKQNAGKNKVVNEIEAKAASKK